ncbi:LysR family transcriptional regulator [Shewanella sp. JM162201]|uniref:LysR family transcriptional regulator n=2 Tax=Shewanella jiangmenensis TaxID=2837387 RepID=A0ABS5V589_9GAMM|nr:LysR family transcriptional regulator [Shewanella jiangmenensis]
MIEQELRAFFVFKSVYETGSAKSVAELYGISQPKVSRYLLQLRETFSDSLFIRKNTGFVPTAKAHSLYPLVCDMVALSGKLEKLAHQEVLRRCVIALPPTLSVGLAEYLEAVPGMSELGLSMSVKPGRRTICEDIIQGTTCIAITHRDCTQNLECKHLSSKLSVEPIAEGEMLFVVSRSDSALWQAPLTLEAIGCYPFVVTQLPGFNDLTDPFERFCELEGLSLTTLQRASDLATLTEILTGSNAVSFLGSASAARFVERFPGLKAEMLPAAEYQRLHRAVPRPRYSLITRLDRKPMIPPLLLSTIHEYVKLQVMLPDNMNVTMAEAVGCTHSE